MAHILCLMPKAKSAKPAKKRAAPKRKKARPETRDANQTAHAVIQNLIRKD